MDQSVKGFNRTGGASVLIDFICTSIRYMPFLE